MTRGTARISPRTYDLAGVVGGAIFLALLLAGLVSCGGAASAQTGRCDQNVRGVQGKIVRESSGLSCSQIKGAIRFVPTTPGKFSIITDSPHLLWKCRLFSLDSEGPMLLACHHHQRRFSVRRSD
jgi:hypothetical protein